jgi:hypothetical protein
MKGSYIKKRSGSKSLGIKMPVNIHHCSSQPRIRPEYLNVPSIVSKVLQIKQQPRKTVKSEICNYKGGGFKGIILKHEGIKSLLPSLSVELIQESERKRDKSSRVMKIKREKFMFKTTSTQFFKESVAGNKLSNRKAKEL